MRCCSGRPMPQPFSRRPPRSPPSPSPTISLLTCVRLRTYPTRRVSPTCALQGVVQRTACRRRDLPLGFLRLALAALLAFAFASSEGTVPDSVLSVRDSAGVRITTSAVSDGGASTVCSLAQTPDMRLASPASGEWTLFRIEDLDRMEDGRLVLVNRGSQELLMFGRDGSFSGPSADAEKGLGSSWTPSSSTL